MNINTKYIIIVIAITLSSIDLISQDFVTIELYSHSNSNEFSSLNIGSIISIPEIDRNIKESFLEERYNSISYMLAYNKILKNIGISLGVGESNFKRNSDTFRSIDEQIVKWSNSTTRKVLNLQQTIKKIIDLNKSFKFIVGAGMKEQFSYKYEQFRSVEIEFDNRIEKRVETYSESNRFFMGPHAELEMFYVYKKLLIGLKFQNYYSMSFNNYVESISDNYSDSSDIDLNENLEYQIDVKRNSYQNIIDFALMFGYSF